MIVREIPVDQVVVPAGRRPPRDVEALAESIRAGTLLHPITLTESNRLVAGGRRLAAYKLLGRDTIPARVVILDDLAAELAEIDENLERDDLTALERGELYARRKKIYVDMHPETRPVNERGGPGRGHKKTSEIVSPVSPASNTMTPTDTTPQAPAGRRKGPLPPTPRTRPPRRGRHPVPSNTTSRLPTGSRPRSGT
jgi:hypothetical protein